jgi:ADP-heptose:LPS heptosyltransferase
MFIGNNSGPMNIAAAMGINTVIINGPSPEYWQIFWKDAIHQSLKPNDLFCFPCDKGLIQPEHCSNLMEKNKCTKSIDVISVYSAVMNCIN